MRNVAALQSRDVAKFQIKEACVGFFLSYDTDSRLLMKSCVYACVCGCVSCVSD